MGWRGDPVGADGIHKCTMQLQHLGDALMHCGDPVGADGDKGNWQLLMQGCRIREGLFDYKAKREIYRAVIQNA
jgi:hypothetical protein